MPPPSFRFIDVHDAAQRLGITRLQLVEWIEQGRIKPFSGKGQQSIFRTADIDRLAEEVNRARTAEQAAQAEQSAQAVSAAPQSVGRVRRRDPIKLIGTRLSMDSRWAEITDEDIATWLDATERVQYERVRKVANLAIEQLQRLLRMVDDAEARS